MRRIVSVLLAVLVLAGSPLSAQTTTGTLRGTVTDSSGAIMPGVTVELTGAAGTHAAATDASGQYRFQALTPGVYALKATLDGFKAILMDGLRVEVGRTFDVDLRLEVGGLAETVTVSGESPLIDTSQSAVTVNYNQELIQSTPVLRFSVFDYFQMTPGISSTQVQDSTTSSAFGSNTNENQYQIDGTNITSPTAGQMWPYPNTDIVAEMELVGVGAPAEYGNMQGAVFNIVTKSGGNTMKGLFNWFSQYQATTGNNQPDQEFPYHRERFQDATVQLGGPLMRDRMWWFGSYQYRRDYFSEPGTDPAFPTQDLQDRVFGKLTWQVNQNNNLLFAYHNDHWRLPDTITPSLPPEAAGMGRGHNPTITATWRRVLNNNTTFELRYGGFYNWSSSRGLTEDLITPSVYDEIRDVYSANYQTYSWSNLAPYTTSITARVSRLMEVRGQQHDVRLGLQFSDGGTQSESVWPGGYQITLRDGAPGYIDVRDPSISGGHVRALGIYADDSWALTDRVTVNAGVRFDLNSGDIPAMPILDAARNEVGTAEAIEDLVDWTSISPRLGVNIKLREAGTVMRASYGRYYQGTTTNLFSALSPAQAVTRRFGWNPATQQYDILQQITDPRGTYVVDPDLKAPYTDQYTIGVDHELIRSLALGASYIHKRAEDFVGRVDVGSTFAPETRSDPQTGAPLTVWRRTSPVQSRLVRLTNPGPDTCPYCADEWWQRYNAFLLTLTKRMSQNWQAVGSITVSKTEGLHSAANLTTASSQSSAASTFGDDPNELTNAAGLLPGDRGVMFKLQGSYAFPHDFVVSSNWQWVAGKPYTRRFSVGGLPQGTQTVFLEPRDGSLRMPAQNFVDIRFEKRFRFGATSKVTVMADIINVLNIDTPLTWISEVATSANFAVPNLIANPRRAMFALRYEF
jgi:TonB dependent receptor/Carboxypeptidase regulatory-like domain